jgi:hypothetical protein
MAATRPDRVWLEAIVLIVYGFVQTGSDCSFKPASSPPRITRTTVPWPGMPICGIRGFWPGACWCCRRCFASRGRSLGSRRWVVQSTTGFHWILDRIKPKEDTWL